MKSSWLIVMTCTFAMASFAAQARSAPEAATQAVVALKGKMLLAANGARLAPVYRVTEDGSAQIIIDGKLVTIPASTISMVKGELTTSLSKSQVLALP
ncbi:MAG TPA: hypothetical protein VME42_08905 [Steroidobacteraceae bacterium]|nr:hypothetical protein [Steroidobacteraceae bacterium]